MTIFVECLNDTEKLAAGFATLALTPRQKADIELLYMSSKGVPVTRDSGSRVRGETVHTCSLIGRHLTSHFGGTRPADLMMWVGRLERESNGAELWLLRDQIRSAIDRLRWFASSTPPGLPQATALETLSEVQRGLSAGVAAASAGSRAARLQRLREAPELPVQISVVTSVFLRNPDVVAEVLFRANGICEGCRNGAPFVRASDGSPYLEVHHRVQLAQGGTDTVENAQALCPNCHRQRHYA